MPEGDSLHRLAARLAVLVGQRVAAESPHPRGRVSGVATAVDGRVLESVEARGKHLLLRFDGSVTVRSHLRMRGRWTVDRADLALRGRPWLVLRSDEWRACQWGGPVLALGDAPVARLGPDIVAPETTVADLVAALGRAHPERVLGEALLDQSLVAGIGNLWMAELLWQAGLSSWSSVGDAEAERLAAGLGWGQREMRAAVTGSRGARTVYRRAGRPCRRCGSTIRAWGLGDHNRVAYWCPTCQPGRNDPARSL